MGVVDRSREHVESFLAELEGTYEGFPIHQTTVAVPPDSYERVIERCRQGVARIDVHVQNGQNEILVVENGSEPTVPYAAVDPHESIEHRIRDVVQTATNVEFAIDGVLEATIAGVHDETNSDAVPVYRLVALLNGQYISGTPKPDGHWESEPPESEIVI